MEGFFCASCPDAKKALRWASEAVERLPDRDPDGKLTRCHEVARALYKVVLDPAWEFRVIDGVCGWAEHSWLASRKLGVILDPYAVGRLPLVQLVDPWGPSGHLYRSREPRGDIRHGMVGRMVRILTR